MGSSSDPTKDVFRNKATQEAVSIRISHSVSFFVHCVSFSPDPSRMGSDLSLLLSSAMLSEGTSQKTPFPGKLCTGTWRACKLNMNPSRISEQPDLEPEINHRHDGSLIMFRFVTVETGQQNQTSKLHKPWGAGWFGNGEGKPPDSQTCQNMVGFMQECISCALATSTHLLPTACK